MTRSPRSRRLLVTEIVVVGLVLVVAAIIVLPTVKKYKEKRNQSTCLNNVRQLVIAATMYDSTGPYTYPDKATAWTERNYPTKALICPTYGAKQGNGYGYNTWLSNKVLEDFSISPQDLPIFADSANPDHLLYSNKDIDWRHGGKASVGYADGYVALVAPEKISIEKPKEAENHHGATKKLIIQKRYR